MHLIFSMHFMQLQSFLQSTSRLSYRLPIAKCQDIIQLGLGCAIRLVQSMLQVYNLLIKGPAACEMVCNKSVH